MLVKLFCIAMLSTLVYSDDNLLSPCPGKFDYMTTGPGYWNGVVSFDFPYALHEMSVRIFLDGKENDVTLADNFRDNYIRHWLNYTSLEDNSFFLENHNMEYEKNSNARIFFKVLYNGDQAPLLQHYQVSGREVCSPTNDE